MQRVIDFLDANQWACWLGIVIASAIVLSIDNSHFVPF